MSLLLALMLAPSLVEGLAQEPKISIDKAGTLEELVDAFHAAGGGNVHVDASARNSDGKRELLLKGVRPESALRWIARLWKLDLQRQDDVSVLCTRWGRGFVQRTYDLRPVAQLPGDRPGPRLSLAEGSGAGLRIEPPLEFEGALETFLIDLIKESVLPGSWEGQATIEKSLENRLLVNHSPAAHAGVAWVLDTLSALAPPPVCFSAEIREGDDAPRILSPDEIAAVAATFREARRLQANGVDSQRVHASISEKAHGIVGYVKGEAILENWVSGAAVLDVCPTLLDEGRRIQIELRLAQGATRALEPAQTRPGPLPLQERAALQLGTTLVVPNGGGALIALPGRQVCLLRASAPLRPRLPSRRTPPPPRDVDLLQRFAALPPADLEADSLGDVAAWLRRLGLNVVLESGLADKQIRARFKAVAPATILSLLLKPLELSVDACDEALLIGRLDALQLGTMILDVRDVDGSLPDFPWNPGEEGARAAFTGEDIANLMKNTLHKNRWEEADGKSICYVDGLLFIRNAPDVLQDCAAFVEERRRIVQRQVLLRAETLDLPTEAAENLPAVVDPADLPKGTLHERLGWFTHEEQRTSITWSRAVDHVADYDGEDPIRRGQALRSYLDIRPKILIDGIQLELAYGDPRLLELKDARVRDLPAKTPRTSDVSTTSTVLLPPGKAAVLRWGLPGGQRRLLVLRAQALER